MCSISTVVSTMSIAQSLKHSLTKPIKNPPKSIQTFPTLTYLPDQTYSIVLNCLSKPFKNQSDICYKNILNYLSKPFQKSN